MLTRLRALWGGVVVVKAAGPVPERFLNLCVMQRLTVLRVQTTRSGLLVWLRLADFKQIRPLARSSQTRLRVISWYGLPFVLRRLKGRRGLLAGIVAGTVLLNILLSFVWQVEIAGLHILPETVVREAASRQGLQPGTLKGSLNIKAAEQGLRLALPEAAWIGITVSGVVVRIEIVEKAVFTPVKPAAVIKAAKDGVISEVLVLSGEGMAKSGQTVKRGDVLIRGENGLKGETGRAAGLVKGRVWYEGYGEGRLKEEIVWRTGRWGWSGTVKIGDREFTLTWPAGLFDRFEQEIIKKKMPAWRNSEILVEFISNVYYEVQGECVNNGVETAREQGRASAWSAVQDSIPESAQIITRRTEFLPEMERDIVRVKVYVETIEDIGEPSESL